jgi:hypothetical protein
VELASRVTGRIWGSENAWLTRERHVVWRPAGGSYLAVGSAPELEPLVNEDGDSIAERQMRQTGQDGVTRNRWAHPVKGRGWDACGKSEDGP